MPDDVANVLTDYRLFPGYALGKSVLNLLGIEHANDPVHLLIEAAELCRIAAETCPRQITLQLSGPSRQAETPEAIAKKAGLSPRLTIALTKILNVHRTRLEGFVTVDLNLAAYKIEQEISELKTQAEKRENDADNSSDKAL